MLYISHQPTAQTPWNKGKLIGQRPPLRLPEIWAIRVQLEIAQKIRDLALFNLAIDSKLRGCDLVKLRVMDISNSSGITSRAMVLQQKTQLPVKFEITDRTQQSLEKWIIKAGLKYGDFLFPSRVRTLDHISTRQYARLVKSWVTLAGLEPSIYGTHSLRRTKATLIYKRTKNLRAVQLLLGHTKIESTVRYLGIEVDDALEMAEQTEV